MKSPYGTRKNNLATVTASAFVDNGVILIDVVLGMEWSVVHGVIPISYELQQTHGDPGRTPPHLG